MKMTVNAILILLPITPALSWAQQIPAQERCGVQFRTDSKVSGACLGNHVSGPSRETITINLEDGTSRVYSVLRRVKLPSSSGSAVIERLELNLDGVIRDDRYLRRADAGTQKANLTLESVEITRAGRGPKRRTPVFLSGTLSENLDVSVSMFNSAVAGIGLPYELPRRAAASAAVSEAEQKTASECRPLQMTTSLHNANIFRLALRCIRRRNANLVNYEVQVAKRGTGSSAIYKAIYVTEVRN